MNVYQDLIQNWKKYIPKWDTCYFHKHTSNYSSRDCYPIPMKDSILVYLSKFNEKQLENKLLILAKKKARLDWWDKNHFNQIDSDNEKHKEEYQVLYNEIKKIEQFYKRLYEKSEIEFPD